MQRFMRHVPNILTVGRIAALPLVVWLYSRDVPGASWPAAIVIFFAAMSDVADGYIARRFGASSEFGRWVDPTVDRAFFFAIVAMLWYYGTLSWWAVLPLLIRDGIILALVLPTRKYTHEGPQISRWGKAANFILICALQWFIVDIRVLGWAFWVPGAALYVGTGLLYGYRAIRWIEGARGGGGEAA